MKIAIADDILSDREELIELLNGYFMHTQIVPEYHEFDSGEGLVEAAQNIDFDVVFLDIYMNKMNGIETARELLKQKADWKIIFLSTSHDHAVESYEVRAVYYLTKPLSAVRLKAGLDYVLKEMLTENAAIQVHVNRVKTNIKLNSILYVDCLNKQARIHLYDRVLEVDGAISDITDMLIRNERFIMCNRNVAVNLEWVEEAAEHEFILKNTEHVQMRQRKRSDLRQNFLEFALKKLRQEETI